MMRATTMMTPAINKSLIFLACLFIAEASHANIFSDVKHWVHHEYDLARKAWAKLEKIEKDSAKYIASKKAVELEHLADVMIEDVEKAVSEVESLLESLDGLKGQCETETGKLTGPLASTYAKINKPLLQAVPRLHLDTSASDALPFIDGPQCQSDVLDGIACGIFPYVKNIIVAIPRGAANLEHFSKDVGKAYKSDTCSSIGNPEERGTCAVILAAMKSGQRGYSCVSRVIENATKGASSSGNFPLKDQKQICTFIGNVAFGFAADHALVGAVTNEESEARKILKIAMIIRTALSMQAMTEDSIESLCHEGIKDDTKSGKIPSEAMARISTTHPGTNLKLITLKDKKPICLDYDVNLKIVHGWRCHGRANQRWSFNETGSNTKLYQVENQFSNLCLAKPLLTDERAAKCKRQHPLDPTQQQMCIQTIPHTDARDKNYSLQKCDKKDEAQLYKITKEGELKNKLTGKCFKNSSVGVDTKHNDFATEGPCVDQLGKDKNAIKKAKQQGALYTIDPSLSLVKGEPGGHRQIYVNPEGPTCMTHKTDNFDMEVYPCNDTSYQTWSFYQYKIEQNGIEYFQIKNDKSGKCITSISNGKPAKVEKCKSMNGSAYEQMYSINEGRLQNRHTGLCLKASGFSIHNRIVDTQCESKQNNQQWHLFKN